MSKFLHVCGIIFAGVGLALGVLGVASPGQLAIYGLTAETAAILLVGGVLSMGLASVLSALAERPLARGSEFAADSAVRRMEPPPESSIFKRRTDDVVGGIGKVGAGAAVGIETAANDVKTVATTSVAETIEALEQAKSDIKAALSGSGPAEPETFIPLPVKLEALVPAADPDLEVEAELPEPEEPEAEQPAEETGLYVVEEQMVRGKAARILSDGTVEAETDEGWMRFENMEHLNEYLDSLA